MYCCIVMFSLITNIILKFEILPSKIVKFAIFAKFNWLSLFISQIIILNKILISSILKCV